MISTKEKELHEKLVEKTKAGKLKWKMDTVEQYSIDVLDFHIYINRRGYSKGYFMGVRKGDDVLTTLLVEEGELFREAESSCETRQKALEQALRELEKL